MSPRRASPPASGRTTSQRTATKPSAVRLLSAERQLLHLLTLLGGSAAHFDFQQLLFLLSQELGDNARYAFVPYRSGAHSFSVDHARSKLVRAGLLTGDEQLWRLTDEGRRLAGLPSDPRLASFVARHQDLRGDALLAESYRRFPFFATHSEEAERVLADDPAALQAIAAYRQRDPTSALCTVGYEGHTPESYFTLLLRSGVTLLCDVRRNPFSHKYGFSKTTLGRAASALGLRYEHLPELGIDSARRTALSAPADYEALFRDYEQRWLPTQGAALERIQGWLDAGARVALTCYEHRPEQCHRRCVAAALEARGAGGPVLHL